MITCDWCWGTRGCELEHGHFPATAHRSGSDEPGDITLAEHDGKGRVRYHHFESGWGEWTEGWGGWWNNDGKGYNLFIPEPSERSVDIMLNAGQSQMVGHRLTWWQRLKYRIKWGSPMIDPEPWRSDVDS